MTSIVAVALLALGIFRLYTAGRLWSNTLGFDHQAIVDTVLALVWLTASCALWSLR